MQSMDPVANLNALADVWRDAAAASERVVGGFAGSDPAGASTSASAESASGQAATGAEGPSSRDVFADFERAIDQMADAAKQFLTHMPFGSPMAKPEQSSGAVVAILDGVGTTEISIDKDTGTAGSEDCLPWATDLYGHDGQSISAENVTIRSCSADAGKPSDGSQSYIVKISAAETGSGAYHGQILIKDNPGFALSLVAKVHNDA